MSTIPSNVTGEVRPQPLSSCPVGRLRIIRVILTDIDDTLTSNGRLTASAYAALWQLHEAGMIVIPVTGRPAGWCDVIARFWPVDGVVGENGAFYFRYDTKNRRMLRRYAKSEAERRADRTRLAAIQDRVLLTVPGSAVASDQAYREADLAIDFCEDVAPLPDAAIGKIVTVFEEHGATAKISSIHVNGWFGPYDKLSMSRLFLKEAFDLDMDAEKDRIMFVGDSPNDASMFEFFPNAVGVANILRFADTLPVKPSWVTKARSGAGFLEVTQAVLNAK